MASATITTKGQVTIPKAVRDFLKLQAGDKVEFVVTGDGEAFIRPILKRVDDIYGRLYKPGRMAVSTGEMDTTIRRKMKDGFQ